jgi:hypothetical protein
MYIVLSLNVFYVVLEITGMVLGNKYTRVQKTELVHLVKPAPNLACGCSELSNLFQMPTRLRS